MALNALRAIAAQESALRRDHIPDFDELESGLAQAVDDANAALKAIAEPATSGAQS